MCQRKRPGRRRRDTAASSAARFLTAVRMCAIPVRQSAHLNMWNISNRKNQNDRGGKGLAVILL